MRGVTAKAGQLAGAFEKAAALREIYGLMTNIPRIRPVGVLFRLHFAMTRAAKLIYLRRCHALGILNMVSFSWAVAALAAYAHLGWHDF
jgi:hypothetical protein